MPIEIRELIIEGTVVRDGDPVDGSTQVLSVEDISALKEDKMRNSTVENLQASFLLRERLLKEHDTHWSLQVSSAGYDIILSFLPWTISVISLPWLDKRLEVVWNTQTS